MTAFKRNEPGMRSLPWGVTLYLQKSTMGQSKDRPPIERAIRDLLDKHAFPVPYHEVRTRLLSNIVCPDPAVQLQSDGLPALLEIRPRHITVVN